MKEIIMNEAKQFSALREFDKRNKKYSADVILGNQIVVVIFGVVTFFFAVMPLEVYMDRQMYLTNLFCFIIMQLMYYNTFQIVGSEQHKLSVFEVLKETPVSMHIICRDRAKKIGQFNLKITAAVIVIQSFSSLIFLHKITIWNILIPLSFGVCAYMLVLANLYISAALVMKRKYFR